MEGHSTHFRLFATNVGGSVWWLLDALYRHGPSWQLVPPIVLAIASLVGAVRAYQDGAQARRHADEKHRAELEAMKRQVFDPLGGFGLETRN